MGLLKTIKAFLPHNNIFISLARLIFYPFTTIVSTPIVLIKTLINSRVLLFGNWRQYPHFNPEMSLVSLFYWTASENLIKFGLKKESKFMGNGNFPLSHFFYHTFLSLYPFYYSGAVFLIICMFLCGGMNMIFFLR